jgi:co-chaperonin GroES (HSP10)
MKIEDLQAVGEFVYIIKDEAETHRNGLLIPEPSIKKPNVGVIISVGEGVQDKNICKGNKAVFSKQVGSEIELFDTAITVLNGNQQINGVIKCSQ